MTYDKATTLISRLELSPAKVASLNHLPEVSQCGDGRFISPYE